MDSKKMAKHFDLDIGDRHFTFSRRIERIEAEARLDGLNGIRTSVPAAELHADRSWIPFVRNKVGSPVNGECAFPRRLRPRCVSPKFPCSAAVRRGSFRTFALISFKDFSQSSNCRNFSNLFKSVSN